MKQRLALALALFGLLALASVAYGDSGSSGSGMGGSGSRGGLGNFLGSSSGDRSGSDSSTRMWDSSSRSLDSHGGYWNSDNRYWWNGGYWEDGCYGCGRWICPDSSYPICPPCQWFNSRRWECEYTEVCAQAAAGRKLLGI